MVGKGPAVAMADDCCHESQCSSILLGSGAFGLRLPLASWRRTSVYLRRLFRAPDSRRRSSVRCVVLSRAAVRRIRLSSEISMKWGALPFPFLQLTQTSRSHFNCSIEVR